MLFQVEVEFGNGSVFKLSAEFLRISSPAVDGKIRSIGGQKVLLLAVTFGIGNLECFSASPLKNYLL